MDKIRKLIKSIIKEELSAIDERRSQVTKDAKSQGLTYMQFGRWGKDGKVTHMSLNGHLVPYNRKNIEMKTGLKFAKTKFNSKDKNNLYDKGNEKYPFKSPRATVMNGRVIRDPRNPKSTPNAQRLKNQPSDELKSKGNARLRVFAAIDKKVHNSDVMKYIEDNLGKTVSAETFRNSTGLNNAEVKLYPKLYWYNTPTNNRPPLFNYDSKNDTVTINKKPGYTDVLGLYGTKGPDEPGRWTGD